MYTKNQRIDSQRFFQRLELELLKLWYLQRFTLSVFSRSQKENKDISTVFEDFGADHTVKEITREKFKEMLIEMDLICDDDNEFRYFLDEYDNDDTGVISTRTLEEDHLTFLRDI